MKLNKGKRKVLPLGKNHLTDLHTAGAIWLESSFSEKNLGVQVDSKPTMSQQCTLTAKKENRILAVLGRMLPADQNT